MSTAKTLELPPALGEALKWEAARAGLSYEEEATLLLYLGTSLMDAPGDTPFGDAVKEMLTGGGLDAEAVGAVLRDVVRRCAAAESDLRAPLPEALRRWREAEVHQRPASTPYSPSGGAGTLRIAERRSAFGKYAGMTSGSEELARRKQEERELEDRERP